MDDKNIKMEALSDDDLDEVSGGKNLNLFKKNGLEATLVKKESGSSSVRRQMSGSSSKA